MDRTAYGYAVTLVEFVSIIKIEKYMANKNEQDALGQTPQVFINDPEYLALQKAKTALELEELEERVTASREKKESHRKLRAQTAREMEDARKKQMASQNMCAHKKPNGFTAVAGQRLNNGHYALICQYCYKEFDETTIPFMLRPAQELIGGPTA